MRLIDADKLRKCAIPCEIHNGALTDLCVPLYHIDNAPTFKLTVEPVKAFWIKESDCEGKRITYICSNCNFDDGWNDYVVCPKCKAEMTGVKKD